MAVLRVGGMVELMVETRVALRVDLMVSL